MLYTSYTPTWPRTVVNLMLSTSMLDIKHLLSRGELDVLLLVFLVYVVVVLTDQVRLPLVTCAEVDACLPQPKPGVDGIVPSTRNKGDTQSALHWQPVLFLLC